MGISRKIAISTVLIAGFIFFVSVTALYVQTQIAEFGFCPIPIPILIPTFASLGIFVGSSVYYLMSVKIEESKEKRVEVVNAMLDLLRADEKETIKKIIENKGEISQSKLSSFFGKVKTFRVIEDLMRRDIVEKEPYGKTNKIKLNDKFKQVLC
ncbi:MAG: hypothetical protein QMD36_05530 [Candidatus Aenigmarchaeota archaeon]|nr:hypothetical protein [Candidatus Aenigmarchaeota archaeon]